VVAVARELSEKVKEKEVFSRVCKKGKVKANVLGAGNSRFWCRRGGRRSRNSNCRRDRESWFKCKSCGRVRSKSVILWQILNFKVNKVQDKGICRIKGGLRTRKRVMADA
jgi:hypothetical protein